MPFMLDAQKIGSQAIADQLSAWCLTDLIFSEMFCRTRFVMNKTFPTIGVRIVGGVIQCTFNPEFIDKLKVPELCFVLLHEALHIFNRHFSRCGFRNPKMWNVATDAAINTYLMEHAKTMVTTGVIKMCDKGITLEGVIKEVGREAHMAKDLPLLKSNCFAEYIYEYVQKYGEKRYSNEKGDGPAGGGGDKGGLIQEGHDVHQPDESTTEEQAKRIVDDIVDSVRNRGKLSGDFAEMLARIGKPRNMGWVRKIKSLVGNARLKAFETSYTRYNKKQGHLNIVVPGLKKIFADDVYLAIDTSGSIGSVDLEEMFGVIDYIARDSKVHVIECDAQIQKVFTYQKPGDWRKLGNAEGRGGTEFQPVFNWMKKNVKQFKRRTLIYLTDGCCPVEDLKNYGIFTIWIMTQGTPDNSYKPPFGKVIYKVMG